MKEDGRALYGALMKQTAEEFVQHMGQARYNQLEKRYGSLRRYSFVVTAALATMLLLWLAAALLQLVRLAV